MQQRDLDILLHEGEGSMFEYSEPVFTGKAFFHDHVPRKSMRASVVGFVGLKQANCHKRSKLEHQ